MDYIHYMKRTEFALEKIKAADKIQNKEEVLEFLMPTLD